MRVLVFVLWRQTLPDADKNALLNAMSFMADHALRLLVHQGFTALEEKVRIESGLDAVSADLIRFVHAGFVSLAPQRAGKAASKRA